MKAQEPLDLLIIDHVSSREAMGSFRIFRTEIERTVTRLESSQEFLDFARNHPRLPHLRVRDVMSSRLRMLPADLSYGHALEQYRAEGVPGVIVDRDGCLVGLCTEADYDEALRRLIPFDTPVSEVMQRNVRHATEDSEIVPAITSLLSGPVTHLVVIQGDERRIPVGLLSLFDIVPHVASDAPQPARGALPRT